MNFSRRPPREPVARRPWEPTDHQSRTRMDPPTTSDTASIPGITLSSSQLELKARRDLTREQNTVVPRDPSIIVTGPTRPVLDPNSLRLSISSSALDHENPRLTTPIRTRNPVSRDSSSGIRTETPQYLAARMLEKVASTASINSADPADIAKTAWAQKMLRNKQVGSTNGSSSSSLRRSDKVAKSATTLRDRMRFTVNRKIIKPQSTASEGPPLPEEPRRARTRDDTESMNKDKRPKYDEPMNARVSESHSIQTERSEMTRSTSTPSLSAATTLKDELDHASLTMDATDSLTEASDMSEEELEGYADMVEILQAEVSGQHSQLWSSFRAVMSGEEPPAPTVVRPPKSFNFDSKTKSALNAMNLHLREHAPVECVHTTQLVNDKKIAKELVANLPSLATSSSLEESCLGNDPISKSRSSYSEASSYADETRWNKKAHGDNLDSVYGRDDTGSENEPEEPGMGRRSVGSQLDKIMTMRSVSNDENTVTSESSGQRLHTRTFSNEHWDTSTAYSREHGDPDPIVTMRSVSRDDDDGNKLYDGPKLGLTATLTCSTEGDIEEEKKSESPYAKLVLSPAGTAPFGENDSNPGLEVTLGQFNSKLSYDVPSTTTTSPSDASTWSDVRLKPSQSIKPNNSAPSISSDTAAQSVPEWATLKLRHVHEGSDIAHMPVQDSSVSVDQGSDTTPTSTTISAELASSPGGPNRDSVVVPNLELDEATALNSVNAVAERTDPPPITSTGTDRVEQARSFIEEADTSVAAAGTHSECRVGSKIDEATVIRLRDTPGLKSNFVARVIVGGKLLMVAHSEPGNPRARVLWKLPRTEIKSLSLDMSSLTVQVIVMSGEHKFLSFMNSEDCLKFANVFYSMKSDDKADDIKDVPSDGSVLDDSIHVESLNDEEHNVLETFRRLRRTKDVKDALNESIKLENSSEQSKSHSAGTGPEGAQAAVDGSRGLVGVLNAAVHIDLKPLSDQLPSVVNANTTPSSPVSAMSISVGSHEQGSTVENFKKLLEQKIGTQKATKVEAKAEQSETGSSNLTAEEETVASNYMKMLRLNFPLEVVCHRMKKEEASERVVAAVLARSDNSHQTSDNVLTEEEETTAKSYRRMLQLGIEKDAVRHKMIKDTVPSKIIAVVVGTEVEVERPKPPSSTEAGDRSKNSKSHLSSEEESVASSYRKLLRLMVPKDKVLERMTRDGISEKIIAEVVGRAYLSSQSSVKTADASNDAPSQSNKLVSLHWTVLSGKELDQSVWKAANAKVEEEEVKPERNDISKLIDLFQKKSTVSDSREKSGESVLDATGKAKLLDITRSNNIAISLKAFKDFSFKELADILAFMDPQRKIRGERVQFLKGLLPTAPEIATVKSFVGSEDKLTPAERWFRQIQNVERIEQKVKVLQTMEAFVQESQALSESFNLLSTVCRQVMDSEKLQVLLGMVLRIGNVMNEGTRTGRAAGFKMDSLLKLTQTKSSDGKMTVLDFLVEVLVEKGQRHILDLTSDFPECHSASRMVIGDLLNETKNLKDSLQLCQSELDALQRPVVPKEQVQGLRGGNVAAMAAALARSKSSTSSKSNDNHQLDEAPKQVQMLSSKDVATDAFITDGNEQDQTARPNTVGGGMARLKEFIGVGTNAFSELESAKKKALDECKEMSRYCGEGFQTGPTTTLLGILGQFASNLKDALAKFDAREAARIRRQRRRGDDVSVTSASIKTAESSCSNEIKDRKASLIVLVNDMLKNANERTIEDFKKGRVIPNPSDRMRTIYEQEKRLVGPVGDRLGSIDANHSKPDTTLATKVHGEGIHGIQVENAPSHFIPVIRNETKPDGAASLVPNEEKPEIDTSSGIQQARAMFENLIIRPASSMTSKRSPTKEIERNRLAQSKAELQSTEIEDSANASTLVTMADIEVSSPNTVEACRQSPVPTSDDKDSLPMASMEGLLSASVTSAIDNTTGEPETSETNDESDAANATTQAPPETDIKPASTTLLLSEARKARQLLEKVASRPQKSALLPLVSARRLSGNTFSRDASKSPVPATDSMPPKVEESAEAPIESAGTTPAKSLVKHERKSIGELARERRASKSNTGTAMAEPLGTPTQETVEHDNKEDACPEEGKASCSKAKLLDLAYMKRENRRTSVGKDESTGI